MTTNSQTWGWVLVALGVLFLLQNMGLQIAGWIWGGMILAAGAGFIWYFQHDRSQWWPLIPGFTLLGLGTLILFEPILGGNLGGGIFLAAIGLGFVAVYFVRPGNWWALIPGGTLLTLGVVAGSGAQDNAGGVLFFTGLAITFGVVFLVGQRWAVFPALACLALTLVTATALQGLGGYIFPLALLAAGVYLLMRRGGPGAGANPSEGQFQAKEGEQ
ncbi:hypothetical protein [uncultured Meiothermus sp.]|jgi:hypothetical protein|uniref:hypothetical protein n=1 Tax=uncultured Meiothermus sp. TaxID=157471 RepID=UPI00263170F0|nr:hypothetical protein [uncultured Meiothermus sp.]